MSEAGFLLSVIVFSNQNDFENTIKAEPERPALRRVASVPYLILPAKLNRKHYRVLSAVRFRLLNQFLHNLGAGLNLRDHAH